MKEDGFPDYQAYFLQQIANGITPHNNAAVLLWKAVGDEDADLDQELAICELLDVEHDDVCAHRLVSLSNPQFQSAVESWKQLTC